MSPVETYGLTHIALGVKDPERAFRFYEAVFGMKAVYRDDNFVQAQTPGSRDVLVFERSAHRHRSSGSIAHFGFRLTDPKHIARAIRAVEAAGGTVLSRGSFIPGEPYVFFTDPDGYEVEIWYELPTPVDPVTPSTRRRGLPADTRASRRGR
jgi:catechol 2,3-dioxygenase-like lactoylglutathione lyase family enzyme